MSKLSMAFLLAGFIGVAWGLANFFCMAQVTRVVVEGRRGWRLAGWVALKVLGLYGLLAWLLLGARISPLGWLAGFTLSLIAAALRSFSSLRGLTKPLVARHD